MGTCFDGHIGSAVINTCFVILVSEAEPDSAKRIRNHKGIYYGTEDILSVSFPFVFSKPLIFE